MSTSTVTKARTRAVGRVCVIDYSLYIADRHVVWIETHRNRYTCHAISCVTSRSVKSIVIIRISASLRTR